MVRKLTRLWLSRSNADRDLMGQPENVCEASHNLLPQTYFDA